MKYILILLLLFSTAYGGDYYFGAETTLTTSGVGPACADVWVGSYFTCDSSGSIDTIYAKIRNYVFGCGSNNYYIIKVYDNSDRSLVGTSDSVACTCQNGFVKNTFACSTPIDVTGGTDYAFAVATANNGSMVAYQAGRVASSGEYLLSDNETYENGAPDPYTPTDSTVDYQFAVYAHVETSSGGSTGPVNELRSPSGVAVLRSPEGSSTLREP